MAWVAPATNTASQLGVRKFGLEFAVDFQNYIIQLHHNSAAISRAISYLYEWKKRGRIFRNVTHEQFNEEFTEYLLLGLLEDMKHCLQTYGELGCVYKEQGDDGLMPVSNQLSIWDFITSLLQLLYRIIPLWPPFTKMLNTLLIEAYILGAYVCRSRFYLFYRTRISLCLTKDLHVHSNT